MMNENGISSPYLDVLPEVLTDFDISSAQMFLDGESPASLISWAKNRSQEPYYYNDQRFRMVVDRPSDGDVDKAVLVLSEFGTNDLPRLIAKSRIIRDIVDSDASLIIQPSSVIGEPNMNFSYNERKELLSGGTMPYIGRIASVMTFLNNPNDVTIFAPSQGAMIGMAYAAFENTPASSLAIVEAPNIVNRSGLKLAIDFLNSGSDLSKVVRSNFTDHESPLAVHIEKDASSSTRIAQFVLRALHPDNIATASMMRNNFASSCIDLVLDKGGSVVHTWGDRDGISPTIANESIAAEFKTHPKYTSRVLRGMGHSATDFYALDGALARLAHEIKYSN